jgi:hypothetical protein
MLRSQRLILILSILVSNAHAQSPFLQRNSDMYYLLDRYDILQSSISDSVHTAAHPITQKDAVSFLENYQANHLSTLSANEKWEIEQFISKYGEWASSGDGAIHAKRPLFHHIYKKKSHLYHVQTPDYTIVFDPILYYQQGIETNNTKQNLFVNTKGLEARGNILKRIGFYTVFTDNQERGPLSAQQYIIDRKAVPGVGYYKDFKIEKPGKATDYIYAAGYLDASLAKNKINITFGQDRLQIGDGYRSLFLSDFGTNYTFLRVNTKLGRFNYQNLFLELMPQFARGSDRLLPNKYATMHHLSVNVASWLNIGFFESVVFARENHFDFGYLNPIILYRSVEQFKGSPDNAMLGFNFKINTKARAVIYGQAILDEFNFKFIKEGNGWWANKFGFQVGAKMVDLFGVKNLMVQPEVNIIRPFIYSYKDSLSDYTHYNQSLAHPYGANLMEASLQIRYKPCKKLYLSLKSFYNKQGRDTSASISFGGNIYKPNYLRNGNQGIFMFNGYGTGVVFANLNASYEVKDNLFLDIGGILRNEKSAHPYNPSYKSLFFYTGLRLNAIRRQYDY